MSIDIGAKAVNAPSSRTSRQGTAAGGGAVSVIGAFYARSPTKKYSMAKSRLPLARFFLALQGERQSHKNT
jgi:hypothetical protein